MTQPPPCTCPACHAPISIDYLKANLPDEDLKALWAALGGRNRGGRKITAKQQAAMQVTRAANRLSRWCDAHGGFFIATSYDPGVVNVTSITFGAVGEVMATNRRPTTPTTEEAEAFTAWVASTIETLSKHAKP